MSNASRINMTDLCWEVIQELPHTELAEEARVWLKQDALRRQNAQKVADHIIAMHRDSWFGR